MSCVLLLPSTTSYLVYLKSHRLQKQTLNCYCKVTLQALWLCVQLQIHFWQQILRYHHRTVASNLDDTRLVQQQTSSVFLLGVNQMPVMVSLGAVFPLGAMF